ncbi:histidine kinase [Oerskovia sp. M15]
MVGDGRSAGTPEAPWGPPWGPRDRGTPGRDGGAARLLARQRQRRRRHRRRRRRQQPDRPLDHRRPRLFLAIVTGLVGIVGTLGAAHRQPDARPLDLLAFALVLVSPVVLATIPRRHVPAVSLSLVATGVYLLLGYPWGRSSCRRSRSSPAPCSRGPRRTAGSSPGPGSWSSRGPRSRPRRCTAARPRRPCSVASPGPRSRCWLPAEPGSGRAGGRFPGRPPRARGQRRDGRAAAHRARAARRPRPLLSAITVQAGVGLHLLDRDPEQARAALTAIRATSRESLDEVRTVLGIVRAEGGEVPRSPVWDLAALPRLVAQVPGVEVSLTVDDAAHDAAPRLAGIVYRVVQESLTNVQRHAAGATRAVVEVRVVGTGSGARSALSPGPARALVVTVSDDGATLAGPAADRPWPDGEDDGLVSEGYGLRGMRERVTGAGGMLAAAPGSRRLLGRGEAAVGAALRRRAGRR